MEFYQDLSRYYEDIFPLREDKINLVREYISSNGKVLDIGCSTGELAIDLSQLGFKLDGMDLNERMVEKARNKAQSLKEPPEFKIGDMRNLKELYQPGFDGIICFGNTIVHLTDLEEIEDFFGQIYDLLDEGGYFIFQIVNYDRILDKNIDYLPTINNEEKNLKFYRYYDFDKDKHLIYFKTRLIKDDQEIKHQIPLYPLRKKEISDIADKIGFDQIKYYGSFKLTEYDSENSMPLIGVLQKT